ncbi:MAG: hypothetical protein AAFY56_24055, partial [Pseudomonadota bacterium]
ASCCPLLPEAAESSGELIPANPQRGLPVVDALEGLGPTAARRLGEAGSVVFTAYTRQLANEVDDLKAEKRALQSQLDSQRDTLEDVRTENAVLKQKIDSENGVRNLRNFGIAIGTGLASTGLMMGRTKVDGYAIALVVSGGLLLLLSWFAPLKRGSK